MTREYDPYKPRTSKEDEGISEEALNEFYASGNADDPGYNPDDEMESGQSGNSGMTVDEALKALNFADLGQRARRAVLENLLSAIEGGWATPADYANLIRFMKDNGLTLGPIPMEEEQAVGSKATKKLDLPSFAAPEYDS